MKAAVDDVMRGKFGSGGIYEITPEMFTKILQERFWRQLSERGERDIPTTSSNALGISARTSMRRMAASPRMSMRSTCPESGCRLIMSRSTITTASSETGSPMRTVIMMCIGTSREIAGVWRCGSMRQSSRRWRGLASMHDECNAKPDILRYRIFAKSPCRPRPFLKRLAPATPSSISASRPLYHS